MVRPAGPRISSMMALTLSRDSTLPSRRSVLSYEPTSEPVEEICSEKSTNSRSTMLALIVPRLDMLWEISLISSSSISEKSFAACSSPMASISIAAFSGPVSVRKSSRTRMV